MSRVVRWDRFELEWTGLGCDLCGFGTVEDVDAFDARQPCRECGTINLPHQAKVDLAPGRARATTTAEGYLQVDAFLARDGCLRYSDGVSSWLEYRPRASLEAAAASWAHKPVTDDHPPVMVDASNATQYARGTVISPPTIVTRDGVSYLAARLQITDADLITKIRDGQRELSIGFMAEVRPDRGISPDGQRYDAVQVLDGTSGNHVASVMRGRAGPECAVLFDSALVTVPVCYARQVKPDSEPEHVNKVPSLDAIRARRAVKFTSAPQFDAAKAWAANAVAKIKADEVGLPTTMAVLVGPDGTEIEVPTWVAALVAEALDAHKAGQAAAEPVEPGTEIELPADGSSEPGDKPDEDDDEDEDKMKPMTPDQINALVRRRGRLERAAITAGMSSSVIDSADDTALARSYVAHVLPHAKADADVAEGAVLDALVALAIKTPRVVEVNPFEVAHKLDADDKPEDDPIVLAYAANLSR